MINFDEISLENWPVAAAMIGLDHLAPPIINFWTLLPDSDSNTFVVSLRSCWWIKH